MTSEFNRLLEEAKKMREERAALNEQLTFCWTEIGDVWAERN